MTEQLVTYETAMLAKKKGFDEACRSVFQNKNGTIVPIDPPPDTEMMGHVRGLILQYINDLPGLLAKLGTKDPQPLKNSTLPENTWTRPSQDLLERWFRETHRMLVGQIPVEENGKIIGFKGAPPIYYDKVDLQSMHYSPTLPTMEEAREASLQDALKTLPDAT